MSAQSSRIDDWVYQQLVDLDFLVSDSLKDLTKYAWTIFACTPICNYSHSESALKELEKDIKCSLEDSGLECVSSSIKFVPFLAVTNKDPDAMEILLKTKDENGRTSCYNGVFISRTSKCETNINFFRLPVLLCRGQMNLITKVNSIIESLFDISISRSALNAKEMLSVGLLTILKGDLDECESIKLKYFLPDFKSATLCYMINVCDFRNLWKSMCESIELVSGNDIFIAFYNELIKHFRKVYGIDLSYFILKSIVIDKCAVSSNGQIKTTIPEVYDFLLKYLTVNINAQNEV